MTGNLSAHARVTVTDLTGKAVAKKVSLGKLYCVDLETAKARVDEARFNNQENNPEIVAVFTVHL